MQNTGLKNPELVKKILEKGSYSISKKNDSGLYVFSGSNSEDGVISGQLIKPNYNREELEKSIDIIIEELLPIEAPLAPDTVPRPVYNEVTQSVLDLSNQVTTLTSVVYGLQSKLNEVQLISESLRIDLDSKDLIVAASENQTQQSVDRIQTTVVQLQNSIQKATSEAIQRVSLNARAESLQQEVDLLREQLFGKQAQQEAGAVSTPGGLTILITPEPNIAETGGNSIYSHVRYNQIDETGFIKYGNTLEVGNYSGADANIQLKFNPSNLSGRADIKWFSFSPSTFTLKNNEKQIVKLTITQQNKSTISGLNPTRKAEDARNYDGELQVLNTVNNDSKIIKTRLRKY